MFRSKNIITLKTRLLANQVAIRALHKRGELIQIGDGLPECTLYENFPTNTVHMPDLVVGRNVVMFAVPGAFTPGCSRTHLPGFLKHAIQMKKAGIDEIVCVSVNDPYVMGAWASKHETRGKVRMLADPTGAFIGAMGLGVNIPTLGGFRAKRFSMVITNNTIKELNVEPDATGLTCSLATQLFYKKHIRKGDDEEEQ
uniref:Peroxiredoxin-5 n=1 Tax=Heliothis virescens TaxID=7102 RepID=A0A2A4J0I8_HELVI